MKSVRRIRIVVGYPSDAKPGRDLVFKVLQDDLFKTVESAADIQFQPIDWISVAGPGIHKGGAQGFIDLALQIAECDLFIAIFFHKVGTPFTKDEVCYRSGTDYELRTAIRSWQRQNQPKVWACFASEFDDEKGESKEASVERSGYL